MKSKLFSKVRVISATLVLLSISLVTGFAEGPTMSGCPPETGGYAHVGNRSTHTCSQSVTETGYYWHINGEVRWVGAIIAKAGGYFEKGKKTKTFTGQQYQCDGMNHDLCWVCNCYYQPIVTIED